MKGLLSWLQRARKAGIKSWCISTIKITSDILTNLLSLRSILYSAVEGSIIAETFVIILAGNPPSRACSRIRSSLGAV